MELYLCEHKRNTDIAFTYNERNPKCFEVIVYIEHNG